MCTERRLYGWVPHAAAVGFLAATGLCTVPHTLAAPVKCRGAQVELVSEAQSITPREPFWVACKIDLEPGWHTYWRNPGEAGVATKIKWLLPPGFQAGLIQWPFPERFDDEGVVSFGYAGHVALLTEITPPADLSSAGEIRLAAHMDFLVCKEICISDSADMDIRLPVRAEKPVPDPKQGAIFTNARGCLPRDSSGWGMSARREGKTIRLALAPPADARQKIEGATFFPATQNLVAYDQPAPWQEVGGQYMLGIPLSPLAQAIPRRLVGVLVTEDGWWGVGTDRALDVNVPIEK
jgi:DsbC/DsbD-like thiol-disulfide interchange protein